MKSIERALWLTSLAAVTAAASILCVEQRCIAATSADAPAPALEGSKPAPAATLPAVDDNKVIFSMGAIKCTAYEFSVYISECDPATREKALVDPQARLQLAEQYINAKLWAAEAKSLKLDETLKFQFAYDQLLSNALAVKFAEQEIENRKFFERNAKFFTQVEVRHILIAVAGSGVPGAIRTDAEAKFRAQAIKKALDKGDSFTDLARAESDDKNSAPTGGKLDPVSRGQTFPAFEDAIFSLPDNGISDPVKTPYGYEIIQVLSHTIPTYEQAKLRVPMRRLESLLEEKKQSDKPEFDDTYFSKAKPEK